MKIFYNYTLFELRRFWSGMKKLFLGILCLGLFCGISTYGFSLLRPSDEPAASGYSVVFVMPENAGLHYSLALGMVTGMDSFSSLCTVKKTTSLDEAQAMLDSGEVSAAVIIPEGMIHSIRTGSNDLPATILYPAGVSLETVVFRQIVDDLSSILASSQTGIYTLYDIYYSYKADESEQNTANSELNNNYINTVLDRGSVFSEETALSDLANTAAKIICGALCLLFLLFGITLCSFLSYSSPAVTLSLKRLGLSPVRRTLSEFIASFSCEAVLFTFILTAYWFVSRMIPELPAAVPAMIIPAAFSSAFFAASLQLLISTICKSKQAAVITTFLAAVIMTYLSGGLVPSAFLPDFFRKYADFLPCTHLLNTLGSYLASGSGNISLLYLVICSLILLAAASVASLAESNLQIRRSCQS